MTLKLKAAEFLYNHVPWSSVVWARREFGFEWRWLIKAWIDSEAGGYSILRQRPKNKQEVFMDKLIERDYELNRTEYMCVNGCCVVVWHEKKQRNTGGYGPAGCSCQELDDPRDLRKGPINAEA